MAGEPGPWAAHRRRAWELCELHGFAAPVLRLYLGVADVWAYAWKEATSERPAPDQLAKWAVERVLPAIAEVTFAAGPPPLGTATRRLLEDGDQERWMARWLAGGDLPPVERYLARACLSAALQALPDEADAACAGDPAPRGERNCPRCGGLPQLSVRSATDDPLVSSGRDLVCSRCAQSWAYSRSACPSCGETQGSQRTVYAEESTPLFPHLRIEACASCRQYLIDVDLGRDRAAVAEVDELSALPLDIYAAEHGLTKITPNIMGF